MNKLLSLFFLALVMTAPCWAVSSQSQVSFSSSRMTIREAFSNIEKQSGYTIAYNEAMLNVGQMVNVKSQCTVDEAMTEILAGTGTHHAYQGKIILVVENKQDGNSVYSGIIRDENGPVPGAVIVNKTNNETALSDDQGKFSIRGRSGDVLVVNMLGYKDSQFTLSSQTSNLTIGMEIDKTTLDEVVVVGYGVQKKVNMTGSVSSVNFQSLETQSRPITDASQALSSATPGLQVMQGSGAPNSESFSYNIRGTGTLNSSSPLILVDGMEQSISSVNPADIANVSVLKDAASCAIYGNRGANGVILITTKNGSSDGKIIVSYDATISYNEPLKIIHTVSDYVKYMQLMNESYENAGNNPQFPQNTIDLWNNAKQHPDELAASGYPNYVAYPNTDWWNEIYKKQWMQKHSISISGKEKRSGYTMSLGYTKNPGIVRSTGYERFQ
ncbi:MAG: TonB-dependent receptor plug domain-containing protein, partial [Bacteroidales bacterium]|nr:TonB-dependent receptor plug domain-containing protein [Bacteroidales bacterium]